MNNVIKNTSNDSADSVLEKLARTLLYEGYSLYPYYRSATKNQKPIPFGVIFPKEYNAYNEHSHSHIQSQSIILGNSDLTVSLNVRFLHVKQTELFKKNNNSEEFNAVFEMEVDGKTYQPGSLTIERNIQTEWLRLNDLTKEGKAIPFSFESYNEGEMIFNEEKEIVAKKITSISEISGVVQIQAQRLRDIENSFRLTVTVTNITPVANASLRTRDEALLQSFLSTHIILQTPEGEFISHQDTPAKWQVAMATCNNVNTWPILIDKNNTTLLSSPIILYDYPEINPVSSGDLFDSTEIEEALLLHVNLLSDEETKRIGGNDEKLRAMLNKVSSLTPEDLNVYHSMMKDITPGKFDNK